MYFWLLFKYNKSITVLCCHGINCVFNEIETRCDIIIVSCNCSDLNIWSYCECKCNVWKKYGCDGINGVFNLIKTRSNIIIVSSNCIDFKFWSKCESNRNAWFKFGCDGINYAYNEVKTRCNVIIVNCKCGDLNIWSKCECKCCVSKVFRLKYTNMIGRCMEIWWIEILGM